MSDIGIIDKQRGELELILGELRERDRELNEMVAGHQHQLLSWEEDRQRVLTLEHKSTRLQGTFYVVPYTEECFNYNYLY